MTIWTLSLHELFLLHNAIVLIAVPFATGMGMWYGPKHGYSRKKGACYAAAIGVCFTICSRTCRWIFRLVDFDPTLNSYRTFLFTPLFALLFSRKFKISPMHGADFMTPIMFLSRAICLIGCISAGCGMGVPCEWGIYSPLQGCRVFPMDPIDMVATFATTVFAVAYAKKLNYRGKGRIFALSLCLMGVVRWLLQFASQRVWLVRGFNDETVYSIVAIIMTIVIFYKNRKKPICEMEEIK